MFENRRVYRRAHAKAGLISFEVTVKETNLHIQAQRDLSSRAVKEVLRQRQYLETHISDCPEFASSLSPLPHPRVCAAIVSRMISAAEAAGVGPMAAVAGAVAEFTGRDLLAESREVVVENGGDIFVCSSSEMIFTIFAGDSPLSMKTGIRVLPVENGYGICTSSGTLGHSKSFGRADAVCVLSDSCALADAAATALCNRIQTPEDIQKVIGEGRQIPGVRGLVIIAGSSLGAWGELELVRI